MPAAPASAATAAAADEASGHGISDFYAARQGRALWIQAGYPTPAAQQLLRLLQTATLDGLRDRYNSGAIAKALGAAARGNQRAARKAEQLLSEAFVEYASDLRAAPPAGMHFIDAELLPRAPSPRLLLEMAAAAPSTVEFVRDMRWMSPLYAPLRKALANGAYSSSRERDLLRINLERARALPPGNGRFILVNAAAQKLFMYENGQPVDMMRVVVGKPRHATPMMAAYVRFASLNPYWYVPPDLAAERIAPNVLSQGVGYLKRAGYEVMADWDDESSILDPKTVDWEGVVAGQTIVYIRQRPGRGNGMGRMKFMFPNRFGIYLHDTPDKQLLSEASRLYSGGCVRLEDAGRLGSWLFGKPLDWKGAKTEEQVPLQTPVPVFITYLTAVPSGSSVVFFDDIYGRDAQRLAEMRGGSEFAAAR